MLQKREQRGKKKDLYGKQDRPSTENLLIVEVNYSCSDEAVQFIKKALGPE
jgi:hypothetical protein